MERGDLDAAADAFERMLANDPGQPVATMGLAQVNLFRRVSSYDQAQARKDAAAHPADVDAQIRVADIEMSLGNAEEAFDRLLGVIRRPANARKVLRDLALRPIARILGCRPSASTPASKICEAVSPYRG